MARMGVGPEQTVIVGDQIFTDILAGNLAGVRTILVRPQSRRDLWYTQIFRLGESLVLRGVEFEGEAPGTSGRSDG
jgi:predicted HAD superfamily phosphohydrolase YqeG